jgi:hypothetical protein
MHTRLRASNQSLKNKMPDQARFLASLHPATTWFSVVQNPDESTHLDLSSLLASAAWVVFNNEADLVAIR